MENLFYIVAIITLISNTFIFRYQRTTLTISRKLEGLGNPNTQALLTPTWIGALALANMIIIGILVVWSFFMFNWIWALAIVIYKILGTALIDLITPLPTSKQCLNIITESISTDIKKQSLNKIELEELLEMVIGIKNEF